MTTAKKSSQNQIGHMGDPIYNHHKLRWVGSLMVITQGLSIFTSENIAVNFAITSQCACVYLACTEQISPLWWVQFTFFSLCILIWNFLLFLFYFLISFFFSLPSYSLDSPLKIQALLLLF